MAPSLTETIPDIANITLKESKYPAPLELRNALDGVEYEDITPVIGREFLNINIVDDILNHPDADARIRDVAVLSIFLSPFVSPYQH
jgi:hypothetical protein